MMLMKRHRPNHRRVAAMRTSSIVSKKSNCCGCIETERVFASVVQQLHCRFSVGDFLPPTACVGTTDWGKTVSDVKPSSI